MITLKSKSEGYLYKIIETSDYNINYNLYKKLLRKKDIKINGKRIAQDVLVNEGDVIEIYINSAQLIPKIETIYEDDNFLLLNNPQGIEVCNGDFNLIKIIEKNYLYIKPCHRLDRNTAGLVIFAKNEESFDFIKKESSNKNIYKFYIAHVDGLLECNSKKFKAYINTDKNKALSNVSDKHIKGYSEIATTITTIKTFDESSIVEVMITSGKTHQIRAHLAYLGHPILGDGKYNKNKNYNALYKKQALIAYKIKIFTDNEKFNYLNNIDWSIDYKTFIKWNK